MTRTIFGQWAIAGAAFFFGIYTMAFVVDSVRIVTDLVAGRVDQSVAYKTGNRYPGYLLPRERPTQLSMQRSGVMGTAVP